MEDIMDLPSRREVESVGNFGYLGSYHKRSIPPLSTLTTVYDSSGVTT